MSTIDRLKEVAPQPVVVTAHERDRLWGLLVAVVEAAENINEHVRLNGGCHLGCPQHEDLHEALAALDRAVREGTE